MINQWRNTTIPRPELQSSEICDLLHYFFRADRYKNNSVGTVYRRRSLTIVPRRSAR
jgi:hypothetical protein